MTETKNAAAAASGVDKDMQERTDGFNKELQPLLAKYELGLAALAVINPNGTIGANPVIISMRKKVAAEDKAAESEEAGETKGELSE